MLDVRRLRLLRELAHRGTIAAVAESLKFTASAVSQQLSALEREAGVPLLERTGRRVTLTPAGQTLAQYAETVLGQLEQADAYLARARQGLGGALRIGAFPTAGQAIIPAALLELARDHPGVEPMVREIEPADVANALRSGELDVALTHEYSFVSASAEPGVDTTALCTETMFLATLPGPTSIAGCHAEPWVTAMPGTLCHRMTIRACQAAGFTPRVRHQVDDFTATLALVRIGQGVALVPQLGATNPPPEVVLTPTLLHRRTRIAYRSGASEHPAVTAITRALQAAVPTGLLESTVD
ncbi:LysR substrate-binding domain-containing protein [Actinocrispum sp. NPDC049592]|uniref:LysR family transcriptional regulator n=1 Tax=Actinocrispum sp. NPDC049592 TaxID=3154835 RepID=UPI0034236403